MNFLDANILAYAFYENAHTDKCQLSIKEGGVTDIFALVEAFHIIEKQTSKEKAQHCIKGLLKSNLHIIDVDITLLFEALKRMPKHDLSIFDMIHYSCALLQGCTSIQSYDKDFNGLTLPRTEP
jgi:predicted nucleic acid-binding protein